MPAANASPSKDQTEDTKGPCTEQSKAVNEPPPEPNVITEFPENMTATINQTLASSTTNHIR